MNKIEAFLGSKSVSLPSSPLDLSESFRNGSVSQGYVIVMTGRSGSTWLAAALDQLPGFGNPLEYFSEAGFAHYWTFNTPQDFSDVFSGMVRRYADQGCFGFKINPERFFWLGSLVDLGATFCQPNIAWIDMRRWNLVKQALSFSVAKKSGVWHQFVGKQSSTNATANNKQAEISDLDLWNELLAVLKQEQAMDEFYSRYSVSPMRVFYEEIFDSKSSLLIRVCQQIRPNQSVDLSSHSDKTMKFDKGEYAQVESRFTEKYAIILNEIYSNRANIAVRDIRRRIMAVI